MTAVHVLGIRHHGPGSARAVEVALDEIEPDCVLIEGAPELTDVAHLAIADGMEPPVAGLVYLPDDPARAGFYPMASFSPEWVALRHSLDRNVPVRFVDLPASAFLGEGRRRHRYRKGDVRADPIGALAAAGGYTDAERWWEDVIEHRWNGAEVFAGILDAMGALREGESVDDDPSGDLVREAWMRTAIRAAIKEGHADIAVVCGAWHAPVLVPATFPAASADAARLKGLPKKKVAATWVPWTSGRLAFESGYGAGVESPGWYAHLHRTPADEVVVRFLADAARLLRAEGLDVSSASVIDAVRLADALGTMRRRPLPGLDEVLEAARVVLCGGSEVPLSLVHRRLVVGDVLGRVPDETPMVPLAKDLADLQRKLKLKPSAAVTVAELDLRRESHRAKSHLLHRLQLLGIPWGSPSDVGGTRGTFKEAWTLEWYPELSVSVIEASGFGTTVQSAAEAVAAERAATAKDLRSLTELVEIALLADLPAAVTSGVAALQVRAAEQHDIARLMEAAEPLARVTRYGDVRRADTSAVAAVLRAVVTRASAGLAPAAVGLAPDAATELRDLIDGVHRAVAMADDDDLRDEWDAALRATADRAGVAGGVAGRAVRLLLDGGRIEPVEARRRVSLALSRGADVVVSAAWLEAFLLGDALLLVHDRDLLAAIDGWVADVPADTFGDVLPVLRRAFSTYESAERRMIGEHVRRLATGQRRVVVNDDVDPERAALVHPRLREILGAVR